MRIKDIAAIETEFGVDLQGLNALIDGDISSDLSMRLMYATDASAYRELPVAVARPANERDIVELVKFASKYNISLIPRTAGTSLAGQVVGNGMVVDISRYMTGLIDMMPEKKQVRVQPGIILDELNISLKPYGLFFSPETSTSNRCMIGGMIGNNSSGLHSVVYGTTREHLESVRMVLSDGSVAEFGALDKEQFGEKCKLEGLEGLIYRNIKELLDSKENLEKIFSSFPDPEVVRRNTGYALDELAACSQFMGKDAKNEKFNFCKLIAGSEGTLGIITEAALNLDPLPPSEKLLIPVHMESVNEAIRGNLVALKHRPAAVELMDNTILELTKGNIGQRKNRFFLKGSPGAILIIEIVAHSEEELYEKAELLVEDIKREGLGYHFPLVKGADITKVWALRKAGLGVLSRMKGDAKPVSVIEDTSVTPSRLESYIEDFNLILEKYDLECVYHAHISVGELHLRPVLNLKDPKDVVLFHTIAEETAKLVKKYRGSLSGEHGDGRLRGEFIPLLVGDACFNMMRSIKDTWDPEGIFNRNKVFDTPPMNTYLRYEAGHKESELSTYFDFSAEGGILRHIQQCNGSGDCRKTEIIGGTMCPSYMASREEWTTTRARANILREFIGKPGKKGTFDHKEVYHILDLCLGCKACKSECPSSVDMAKLKSEFLQHWYDGHGIPLRTRMIAYISGFNKLGAVLPGFYNALLRNAVTSGIFKRMFSFAPARSIPLLHGFTLKKWIAKNLEALNRVLPPDAPSVYLFIDEFTNYNDTEIGIKAIKLLHKLGISIKVVNNDLSARTFISKGLLKKAASIARNNVNFYSKKLSDSCPLIGIEPSAILGFMDEYPDLVGDDLKEEAEKLAGNAYLIEEYLCKLLDQGMINQDLFTKETASLKVHGHCQQKAIATTKETLRILSLPINYTVSEIPSGCCGMAGSFGYEKEHYDLSMKVGELVLFPAVRSASEKDIIVAAGTSCRHQIKDGTGVQAKHPIEVLWEAIN